MINTKTFTSSVVPPAEGCCAMTDRFKRLNRSHTKHKKYTHEKKIKRAAYKEKCVCVEGGSTFSWETFYCFACAFVHSNLEFCNSLVSGCPFYIIRRLRKIQNSAAKLVFKSGRRDHVQPLLQALHWLPVQARIDYKLSIICHNFFSYSSPAYLFDLPLCIQLPDNFVHL